MKTHRLPLSGIISLIVLPLLAGLLFSGYMLSSQKENMAAAAREVALFFAEEAAGRSSGAGLPTEGLPAYSESKDALKELFSPDKPQQERRDILFRYGPPVYGWVALFDAEGNRLDGSGGSNRITEGTASVIKDAISETEEYIIDALALGDIGSANDYRYSTDIKIGNNPESALVIVPCPDGSTFAAAVVSHSIVPPESLPRWGGILQYAYVFFMAATACGMALLMKFCVLPLRGMSARVATLELGRETFEPATGKVVPEVGNMQDALAELTKGAVDRERLRKSYENDSYRIREDERDILAENIHDYPLQTVVSLVQQLNLTEFYASQDDKERAAEHLAKAKYSAQNAIKNLRGTCNKLSPQWLKNGAELAFDEIAKRLSKTYVIQVLPDVEEGCEPTKRHLREMCNIVRIAVENSAFHGEAGNVSVKLESSGDEYVLTIKDDGKGLPPHFVLEDDPSLLKHKKKYGLAEMLERTNSLDGTFSIANAEDGGTLITVTMPREIKDAMARTDKWRLGADMDLQSLATELSREHHIEVTAETEGDDNAVPPAVLREFRGIIRQAAANAAHHGDAKKVRAKLSCGMENYVLTVGDDGSGVPEELDTARLAAEGHRGLSGMKNSAEALGGSFTIGNTDHGALVTVTVPVRRA